MLNFNIGQAVPGDRFFKGISEGMQEVNTEARSMPIARVASSVTGFFTGKNIFGDDMTIDDRLFPGLHDEGMSTIEIIGYAILGAGLTGGSVYMIYKFKELRTRSRSLT